MANAFDQFDQQSNPFDVFDSPEKKDEKKPEAVKSSILGSYIDRIKNLRSSIDLYTNIPGAVLEPALKMATGMVAKPVSDIAGIAALTKDVVSGNKNGDPQGFKRYVQQALTYEPRTAAGKSELNPLNFVPEAIGKGINAVVEPVAETIAGDSASDQPRGMAANAVREGIPQALGIAGAKYSQNLSKAAAVQAQAREAIKRRQALTGAQKNVNIVQAKEAGFKLPPSESGGGRVMQTIEGAVGRGKLVDEMENFNARKATQIIHDDLGLPEHVPLTTGAVEEVISNAGKVYEKIRGIDKPFVADKTYLKDLAVMQTKMVAMKKNKTTWNPEFADIMDDMKKSLREPSEAVDLMKSLRADSSRNFAAAENATTAKPNVTELAKFQKQAAKNLEDLVHRNLEKRGLSDLSAEFIDARKTIAKSKTIQKVLDENGIINAEKLGHLKERGAFMSEGMDKVAKFGRAFQDVAGKPKASSTVPVTAWEGMLGAGGAGAGFINPIGWSALAFPAARIIGREYLKSNLGQKMVGGVKAYKPGTLSSALQQFSELPPQAQQALAYSLLMQSEQSNQE